MVAGEGRPKRACADGIDYAGTDQVPGWTVRVSFFFCCWNEISKFFSRPLSLRLIERVLFLFLLLLLRRRRRRLVLSRYYSPRGVLSQIADFDKTLFFA